MRFSHPARAWLRELLPLAAALAGIFTIGIWLARPQLTVAAADTDARRTLGGFWALERNATDSFRWARPEAALRLFGFEQRAPLLVRVRLSAARPADQPLVRLTLANSAPPLELTLAREWRVYTLLLPALPADAEGRLLALHSLADPPYPDPRPLGFALSSITVAAHPQSPADRLPAGGRLLFLVLAGLAAYVALRRWLARTWAAGLVLLPALGLGVALALAPLQVGYWLPNLWLVLGLAWLLLLAPALVGGLWLRLAGDRRALLAGLVAVAAAQALLPMQRAWSSALGWPLLLVGAALVALVLSVGEQSIERRPTTDRRLPTTLALALITLVALALRLVNLDGLPPGLWRDEARHGLLALRILHDPSFRPVYVPTIADLPALLFYLIALPIHLFGPQPWAARLVPALAGALTPLALFLMARPLFGARAALFASGLLAASAWHITLSRFAFPTVIGPLLTLFALGWLWQLLSAPASARQRLWAALGIGLALGTTVYAYHTSRLTPLLFAALVPLWLGRDWVAWRPALPRLMLAALLALVLAAPLLGYAWENQRSFSQRIGKTSVFNADSLEVRAPLARLEENLGKHLGMWNAQGDYIGRHNLPLAPMLDPITGGLFAIGAAATLLGWRERRARLVLAWLAMALIAGLFSIEAPHAMRTIEALAPTMMLAGIAADRLLGWRLVHSSVQSSRVDGSAVGSRQSTEPLSIADYRLPTATKQARRWLPAAAWLIIVGLNGWRYFVEWPAQPKVIEQFYVADTQIGLLAQRLLADQTFAARGGQLFIPGAAGDDAVLRYLTGGLDLPRHEAGQLSRPPGAQALLLAYGDRSDMPPEQAGQALGPAAQRLALGPPMPATGRPAYVVYGVGDVAAGALRRALAGGR